MPRRASVFLLPVIYLGFISLGLPDGTLGVAWPQMHAELRLSIGLAGTLLLVMTLLSAASSFSSGAIIARFQTGPVVLVSCILTGAALLVVSRAQSLWWLALAAVPLGLGAGAVDSGLNAYVARHYSGRHMNWLHACWGIGATCGPLIMTSALGMEAGWRGGYFTLASMQLTLALVFVLTLRLWDAVPVRVAAVFPAGEGGPLPTTPANSVPGWLSAVIFMIYVAVELTAGLWASSILVLSRGISLEHAGLCTTAYYGSITTGRILVGFVVDRWGNRRLVAVGLGIAVIGALLFIFAGSAWSAAGSLVLLGLGIAPVYPCLMHEVPRRFSPAAVQVVIGRQSSASYLGAAFLPAVAGWLAQTVSLESVAWMIAIGVPVLALAIWRLDRMT